MFDAAIGLPKFSRDISRVLDSSRGAGARLFALGMDAHTMPCCTYLDWLSRCITISYVHHAGATGQLAEDDLDRIQRPADLGAIQDDGVARPINWRSLHG